jgi:polyisoprenoid-binding protein YceI
MKKTFFLFAVSALVVLNLNAQQKLTADAAKTKLEWLGEKVTGKHEGTINLQSGWLSWNENKIQSGEFLIDMTSIASNENLDKLVGHLKSDDFFGVEKYPAAKLVITESTSFDKGTASVKGTLTIKGVTNPVEFKAAYQKKDDGSWFFANIVIDRTKYNVRYGSGSFFDNLGDKTIYDEFKLKVSLLVK